MTAIGSFINDIGHQLGLYNFILLQILLYAHICKMPACSCKNCHITANYQLAVTYSKLQQPLRSSNAAILAFQLKSDYFVP